VEVEQRLVVPGIDLNWQSYCPIVEMMAVVVECTVVVAE